jgi:hypothetical protein
MAGYDVDPLSEGAVVIPLAGHVIDRPIRIHRSRDGLRLKIDCDRIKLS